MNDNNSDKRDYFGIKEFPDSYHDISFEVGGSNEQITDFKLRAFDEPSKKKVSNLNTVVDGFNKIFLEVKEGKVKLKKKALAGVMAGVMVASGVAGGVIGSSVNNSPDNPSPAYSAEEETPQNAEAYDELSQAYINQMNELNLIIKTYENDQTVENRRKVVRAIRDYRTISMKFLGNEYGFDTLSYNVDHAEGLICIGIDNEGRPHLFDGPSYIRDAINAAESIDFYKGDGTSPEWDGKAMEDFCKIQGKIDNAVKKYCDSKEPNMNDHK